MLAENQSGFCYRRARAAIDLAEHHDLPPIASIFDLLTAHLAGEDPALTDAVGAALRKPKAEREASLQQLYDTQFGTPDVSDGLERVRSGLSKELGDVSLSLERGVDGNLKMAAELRRSLRDIAGKISRDELQLVCRHLVYSGREQLSDTQALAERLERTQYQLSEMRAEISELREKGARDNLTGLHNSTRFADKLAASVAEGMPFCVVMIELDNVRELHAQWGGSVRDNILRGIGALLLNQIKGQDLGARVGPHTFGLVLPDTPLTGAKKLAETIGSRFADITWVSQANDHEIGRQSLSMGVADWRPAETATVVQARADAQLDAAKQAGGDCIMLCPQPSHPSPAQHPVGGNPAEG